MDMNDPFAAHANSAALLHSRAHRAIPGGSHTYAKGDDQFPPNAPRLIERGSGCRVWDVEGREFIEYAPGVRSVTLGHAFAPVIRAAAWQMGLGTNFNRPARIEVEAAEDLLSLLPRADMVKFAKDGSTVLTAAVKLARAVTGRTKVAVCADHPFFSYNDWFLVTTGIPAGIPASRRAETLCFQYNNLASAERLFADHPDEIACVLLEPARLEEPRDDFLHRLRDLAHRHGALFVLDELTTGLRWHIGGAQAVYDIAPDLSAFGKALGNGFAVSALAGKREFMERGGLTTRQERVFLLSTTHGAETHALAAMRAVLAFYREHGVIEVLARQGARLRRGLQQAIDAAQLTDYITLAGRDAALMYLTRDASGAPSPALRTLLLQELLRRGVLAPSLMVTWSHDDAAIDRTIRAFEDALTVIGRALEDGIERALEGAPVRSVYRRFN